MLVPNSDPVRWRRPTSRCPTTRRTSSRQADVRGRAAFATTVYRRRSSIWAVILRRFLPPSGEDASSHDHDIAMTHGSLYLTSVAWSQRASRRAATDTRAQTHQNEVARSSNDLSCPGNNTTRHYHTIESAAPVSFRRQKRTLNTKVADSALATANLLQCPAALLGRSCRPPRIPEGGG